MYTIQVKSDQHATRIPRLVRVWSQTTRISCVQCIATFRVVINKVEQGYCSRKKGSQHNPQHDGWPIRGSVPSFSPEPTNEEVGAKPTFYWRPASRLTGPISPIWDRYVQYLLTGANPLVLNQHRRGLQPWRCRLATSHSPIFPTDCLHFPPKGPARS
jgi:hypothetical protein